MNRILIAAIGLGLLMPEFGHSAPHDSAVPTGDSVAVWRGRYLQQLKSAKDPLSKYGAFRASLSLALRAGEVKTAFQYFMDAVNPGSWADQPARPQDALVRAWVADARSETDETVRVWYSYHFNAVRGVWRGGTTLEHFHIRPGGNLEIVWTDPEANLPPSPTLRIEVARMAEDSAGRKLGFLPLASGAMEKDGLFHRYVRRLEAPGLYRVCVVDRDFFQQSYVQVGWLDLAVKDDGKTLLAFVSSPRDTLPPPYRIHVTGAGGIDRVVATDTDGLTVLDFPADYALRKSLRLRAVKYAADGKGAHAAYVRGATGFPAQGRWGCEPYTDRPRYRPGDRVHFRGILKHRFPDGSLGDGWMRPVELVITDALGREAFHRETRVDPWGLFGDSLLIPDDAALGQWRFEVREPDANGIGRTDPLAAAWVDFKVEAYRKPEFEIKVKAEWRAGSGTVRFGVRGAYYSGGPLAGLPVEVRWQWEQGWGRPDLSGVSGYGNRFWESRGSGDCLRRDTLILDRNGAAHLEFRPPQTGGVRILTAEAIVRDLSGREVRELARAPLVADTGMLNVVMNRFRYEAGDMAYGRVLRLDRLGNPATGKIRIRITRDESAWLDTSLALRADGKADFNAYVERSGQYRVRVEADALPEIAAPMNSSAASVATASKATSAATASKGFPQRKLIAETAFLAVRLIQSGSARELILHPDKPRYGPGDTVGLVIRGLPAGGRVLVTVEGQGLNGHRVVRIPDAAGVRVRMALPLRLGTGSIGVLCDGFDGWVRDFLPLALADTVPLLHAVFEGKKIWKPGETFQGLIRVLDRRGEPVRARLSIGVVDEAVHAGESNPLRSRHGEAEAAFGNRVMTCYGERADDFLWALGTGGKFPKADEWGHWGGYGYDEASDEARRRRRGAMFILGPAFSRSPKVYAMMGEDTSYAMMRLADPASGAGAEPRERTVFKDEALWLPSVATGSRGEAGFSFQVPDDLTRWRISAKGAGAGSAVIDFRDSLIVRLDVAARIAAPRGLVAGDSLAVSVRLQNSTRRMLAAQARLTAEDSLHAVIDAPDTEAVRMPPGTSIARWPLRALRPGSVRLRATAMTPSGGDAETRVYPITAPGLPRILSAGRVRAASGAGTVRVAGEGLDEGVELDLSGGIHPGSAELRLEAATQPLYLLRSALPDLMQYPYGCMEQTLSRFIPLLQVADAIDRAGWKDQELRAQVRAYADAGLERMESMQGPSGGWGWWRGSRFDLGMTLLAVEGLAAARSGSLPDTLSLRAERLLASGVRSLDGLWKDTTLSLQTQAYLAHALCAAGITGEWREPLRGLLERLFAARARLSEAAQALLLESLHTAGNAAEEKEILDRLASAVYRKDGLAWWAEKEEKKALAGKFGVGRKPDGSGWSVEDNALILGALARCAPDHPLVLESQRWILSRRRGEGWGYTRVTAAALSALTRVAGIAASRAGNPVDPGATMAFSLNGKPLSGPQDAAHAVLTLGPDALDTLLIHGGSPLDRVDVEFKGKGYLYWSAQLRYADGNASAASGRPGLRVQRWYRKAVYLPEAGGWLRRTVLLRDKAPGEKEVRTGDEIEVSILVESDTVQTYLAVEDFFPSGMEYLDRTEAWMTKYASAWYRGYDHKEARDDRMAFFLSWVPKGKTLFTYLLRAETPGRFIARPARAELMYQPEFTANTRQDTIRIVR
ncbi:MAG: MG2 domain-containing protein [Fibrobacteria bacterium]